MFHECITLNHLSGGCGNMKDEQKKEVQTNKTDSKEEQNQRTTKH